ncbi:MAG: hypothetical protein IJA90_11285 [Peptococcaceae bacterium]|nr:hypothetical protein [Peptococcaceae bacterium]
MNEKLSKERVVHLLAINLVGVIFILVGCLHLFDANKTISDILNIWSLLFVLGTVLIHFRGSKGKILLVTSAERANNNFEIAGIVANLLCFLISLILAYLINMSEVISAIGWNTNGFTIIAMGVSALMFYHK